MKRMLVVIAVSLLVGAGCGGNPEAASPAPTTRIGPTKTAPAYVGTVGVPVHAVASDGATADITLNAVRLQTADRAGGLGYIVFDLTFAGTSAAPFRYSESFVTWDGGGGSDPFNHPDSSTKYGGDPSANYTAFMPPAPLRIGQVVAGSTRRGLVIADFNGGHQRPFILTVSDPSTVSSEAQWMLVSP